MSFAKKTDVILRFPKQMSFLKFKKRIENNRQPSCSSSCSMIGRNIFSKYPELSFPWEAKQRNTPIIYYNNNNNKMRTTTLDCHSTGTVPDETLKTHTGNPSCLLLNNPGDRLQV